MLDVLSTATATGEGACKGTAGLLAASALFVEGSIFGNTGVGVRILVPGAILRPSSMDAKVLRSAGQPIGKRVEECGVQDV
jgi:hypothetical protein